MPDLSSTLDLGGSAGKTSASSEEDSLALLIVWAGIESDRIGEVAFFEAEAGARILGRGDASSGDRVLFYRQRPGMLESTPPLVSPGISREQLRIGIDAGGLRVERIGKCPMEIRGERVDTGVLAPGEMLLLKKQLLLLCIKRRRHWPVLRSATIAPTHSFGAPDVYGIVGESKAAWDLRDQLAWLAQADQHTLVTGGSGSGKELCARAVHTLSTRAEGPFVARNAATIPSSLIDAELFGNVKGYPNPGMPERPGLIGAANGGTLFLDEIGELPQSLQANLLRVLDEKGEYHRLGASAAMSSHFRLLGATNRNPEELKHDLAARLVLRLEVPNLDARREDIPLLVRHLLRHAAEKNPKATRPFRAPSDENAFELQIKSSLIEHLLQHRYTTNIRELDALLWRAMSTSTGDAIEWPDVAAKSPVDHPVNHSEVREEKPVTPETPKESNRDAVVEPVELSQPTEAQIRGVLAEHEGNIAGAARALGLSSRYVLYRLMRKYRIEVR